MRTDRPKSKATIDPARSLAKSIGPGSAPARLLIPAFAAALGTTGAAPIADGYARWREATSRWGRPSWWDWPARRVPGLRRWAARLLPDGIDLPVRSLLFVCETYLATAATLAPVIALCGAKPLEDGSLRLRMIDLEEGAFDLPGIEGGPIDAVFGWPVSAWQDEIDSGLRALIAALAPVRRFVPITGDLFGPVAAAFAPSRVRRRLGAYYTPDDLARRTVELAVADTAPRTICDPTCGSGAFLVAAAVEIRRRQADGGATRGDTAAAVLDAVSGSDISPLAVRLARANLILSVADLLPDAKSRRPVRIARVDSIFDPPDTRFDRLVGNPPWANWETLAPALRESSRPLWDRYGLFVHEGMRIILGSAKKDLSMLAFPRLADRLLEPGGRIAMVMPRAALQSGRAADGFRRFSLPDGTPLAPVRVEDWTALRPFGSQVPAVVLVCEKGRPVAYPVPWDVRGADGRLAVHTARPVEAGDPVSPWIVASPGAEAALGKVLGASAYRAHAGAYSGGANGVYWVVPEKDPTTPTVAIRNVTAGARKPVPEVRAAIESGLLFPLLRSRDVSAWVADPSGWMVLPQSRRPRRGIDESTMATRYPQTLAYLKRFEQTLRKRAAFTRYYRGKGPWWSLFDVGDYTFSDWKVVWRQIAAGLAAAVVGPKDGKPVIPQHTVSLVAVDSADEAYYLCGVLNSGPPAAALASYSSAGTKGFGTPGAVARLNIPGFDPTDARHRAIADAAKAIEKHLRANESGRTIHSMQTVQYHASKLFNLTKQDTEALGMPPQVKPEKKEIRG